MDVCLRRSFSKLRNIFSRNGRCRSRSRSRSFCGYTRSVLSSDQLLSSNAQRRWFGQPAAQTHPHLLRDGQVTPGITMEEYRTRRKRLMDLVGRRSRGNRSGGVLVIIPSSPKSYMSYDIPYPFRQNTDFFYLSGFLEPDSVLLLEAESVSQLPEHRATLFVPRRDPHRELWDGPRSGTDGAVLLTGVDSAYNMEDLGSYLERVTKGPKLASIWYDRAKPIHSAFHLQYFAALMGDSNNRLETLRPLVQSLRVIKSSAEIELMKQSCDIASQSFREVMKFSRPGINESHLYAKMDFECRMRNAEFLAYPPVVAGGDRANTIHYIANNQLIVDGEMVLMDAGCECHGYTSDITRSWPVNGHFSPVQRDLYEALLEVQEACVQMCFPGNLTMNEIYGRMLLLLGKQLQQLGIVSKSLAAHPLQMAAREFCPHHVSHYLGMDVHDTDEMPRSIKLAPAMVITIEPGIYISKSKTDAPKEMRGIGLRIEDDILVTTDGPYNLCSRCPKHPSDIETVISSNVGAK